MSLALKLTLHCDKVLCDQAVEVDAALKFDERNIPVITFKTPAGWEKTERFHADAGDGYFCPGHSTKAG